MAVSQPPEAFQSPMLAPIPRKRSHSSTAEARPQYKWIDEDTYRTSVLCLYASSTESDVDDNLQTSARDLGLLPVQKPSTIETLTSSLSATTFTSENNQGSIMSQSTAPTSCASSERRPSTSLSRRSSRVAPNLELPAIVTDMQKKRSSGFKIGLRKMTGFARKKSSTSSTPSMTSLKSHRTNTTTDEYVRSPPKRTSSFKSRNSFSSQGSPLPKETFEQEVLVDEAALRRSLACDELIRIRTQQVEEKRRFLEYQTRLIAQLLQKRDQAKTEKREAHEKRIAEEDEKNEKAVETLEARQLEDEIKQQKEHEVEKRAIQTRLKHMEAYCQTPSPPHSPAQATFEFRPSEDSMTSLPERHITQQHYENLAQAYHIRDNMDDLHTSKINVLRGKQKRALQNFMLKKERQLEQVEKQHKKELDAIDADYAKQEAEIRHEFDIKRAKLEARWKLQALIEKTKMERSTGLKYESLPDMAIEA